MPTSSNDTKTPITLVKSSGALPPAAINVAPATSSVMPSFSMITSREGTKNSSQTMASATNIYITPMMCRMTAPFSSCSFVNRSLGNSGVFVVVELSLCVSVMEIVCKPHAYYSIDKFANSMKYLNIRPFIFTLNDSNECDICFISSYTICLYRMELERSKMHPSNYSSP